jgi:hypothetical protein
MRKDVKILCLPDKAVSHAPDQILGSVLQYLGEGHSKDEMMAMGRMITWLGLGTRDQSQQFGVKPGYLIKRYGADWIRGRKRTKEEPTIDESKYIEWIVESALGVNYQAGTRDFVLKVLTVLRLVGVSKRGEPVPTKRLTKLVLWRQAVQREMHCIRRAAKDKKTLRLLAARRDAALHIDPDTAGVMTCYKESVHLYRGKLHLPEGWPRIEYGCFARAPQSDIWVWFGDLPYATFRGLLMKHYGHFSFMTVE